MTTNTPDLSRAVEAAARVNFERNGLKWETATERVKEAFRNGQREVIEAAYPHIAAAAWDEGAEAGMRGEFGYAVVNPYAEEGSNG